MRLLMTTDTVGGVWSYAAQLTAELLNRECCVALVTLGRAPSLLQYEWLQNTSAHWGSAFRWEACTAPLEWMNDNECAYEDAEPLLLRVAAEFGAELLHSNQFCFGALPLSCPKLLVAHSDVLSWAAACRGRALEPSPWLDQYFRLAAVGLRCADFVIAPTRWMLTALAANFLIRGYTGVIPNGRKLTAPAEHVHRKLQAVTAGRLWDEAKNLRLLETVNAPFPILVAGETAFESNTAPVANANATMLGHLAEDDLFALFRESAIYLCTSRYEPFGLAPLEAALCGCAILANDIPSLREVWGDGALYFSDAASLSALLLRLNQYPDELSAAQHRSGRQAQRYTTARMAQDYLALYQTMLNLGQTSAYVA